MLWLSNVSVLPIFFTVADFDKWRLGEEESQRCRFVKQHGASSVAGGKLRTYYRCHRSGTAAPRRGKGVRLMKSQGSCKSGKICLASITATTNADGTPGASVEVSYQKHHYGHDRDVTHLMMTPAERAKIAAELKTGVGVSTVMDRISASIGGADLTPLQATERIQLHNIRRQFNLFAPERCHPDDATSVKMWVEAMKAQDEPVVRLYKQQGEQWKDNTFSKEDFALALMTELQEEMLNEYGSGIVCVDSTHGTNSYDFQLTTLLVLDEYKKGVPVAHLIRNRTNGKTLKAFFESLKLATGAITSDVFMSDDAIEYYDAWKSVMGQPVHRLLCTWHVDKNWREKIHSLVPGNELQAAVYKAVRVLMTCTDQDEFQSLLQGFIELEENEPALEDFMQYFSRYYAAPGRLQLWPYCYRLRNGVNTNMHLERMHRTLNCDEHLIHFTVCKHIHAVLMASNAARTDDENVQELPDSCQFPRDGAYPTLPEPVKLQRTSTLGHGPQWPTRCCSPIHSRFGSMLPWVLFG
ncbi:uncharacterized protein LOC144154804 [Haemaphysalis longicornis]